MGVRPKMYLVFGIDNFEHSNWPDWGDDDRKLYDEPLYIPESELDGSDFERLFLRDAFMDYTTKKWGVIADFLYYGRDWNPGIVGMIVHESHYDTDMVRVLAQFHDEYEMSGKKDLPILDPEQNLLYARQVKNRQPRCGDIEWQWSWFYSATVEAHSMWPVRAYCARWLFQQSKIEVDYRQFKAMLVWEWS